MEDPSLKDSINISEGPLELAETAFDQILSEGFLKDLPVVGVCFKGAAALSAMREWLYLRKLKAFLQPLTPMFKTDREAFAERLKSNPF
jgi:hypothetical protein